MTPLLLEIMTAAGALVGAVGALGMLRKATQVIGAQRRLASIVASHNKGAKLDILLERLHSSTISDAELEVIIREFEKQLQPLKGSGKESIESSLQQPSAKARKEFASKIVEQASAHKASV